MQPTTGYQQKINFKYELNMVIKATSPYPWRSPVIYFEIMIKYRLNNVCNFWLHIYFVTLIEEIGLKLDRAPQVSFVAQTLGDNIEICQGLSNASNGVALLAIIWAFLFQFCCASYFKASWASRPLFVYIFAIFANLLLQN